MISLSQHGLDALPPTIARPSYDRSAITPGIVHVGCGNFHRAHQAWYTDAALNAGDANWMITGVSLRSAEVAEQMNPQQGLYSCALNTTITNMPLMTRKPSFTIILGAMPTKSQTLIPYEKFAS